MTAGALVTAYQPAPLVTIQQLDPIYVDVTQSSSDLLRLRRNLASGELKHAGALESKVKLLLEDGTPYAREGKLQFRDVTVDPTTGSVVLRMVFPNPNAMLLPGMFVRALVEEGVLAKRHPRCLSRASPETRRGTRAPSSWTPRARPPCVPIVVDRAIGDRWLVTAGLADGDQVIIEGLQRIRPGVPVKVAAPRSAAGPSVG